MRANQPLNSFAQSSRGGSEESGRGLTRKVISSQTELSELMDFQQAQRLKRQNGRSADSALDQLSTSQNFSWRCPYGAPLVAIVNGGKGRIKQSCCNHWECPVCGKVRAKQEYRRMVNGCEHIAKRSNLYFITITSPGRECSLEEAERNYAEWTNHLLTSCRQQARSSGIEWHYVQVTERQQKTRQHPHSHIITTFLPRDAVSTRDNKGRAVYQSRWFMGACTRSGLGEQYRISGCTSVSAVARYVAKYLFKQTMSDRWPPGWKRIRYSQGWPKLPEIKPDGYFTLVTPSDWRHAQKAGVRWEIEDVNLFMYASRRTDKIHLASTVFRWEKLVQEF